jgi:hypothetical protein
MAYNNENFITARKIEIFSTFITISDKKKAMVFFKISVQTVLAVLLSKAFR